MAIIAPRRNATRCLFMLAPPTMAEASKAKAGQGDPFAHVTAAGRGRGLNALARITRMCFRHPWQSAAAIVFCDGFKR